MLSNAPLTTPYTPTNSDRRERQMLAEWRLERDAARRAGLYRPAFRIPRLRLWIAR